MNVRLVGKWCVVTAMVALSANFGLDRAMAAEPGQADAEEGVEVLTRGPVHEAFAETVTFDPEPGILVPKTPPAAIEELPPEQRPAGANVAWIPGYWGWDDERNDFLWVSGIWRNLPPRRQWVPGYWGQSGQGSQWTSGYWADAKLSEVEYLPEPPATVEAGPNIAAPSADQSWLPGCWVWQNGRYAWRPGFWASVQPDWVWIPAHYVSAPRGYVYVDGYWDYSVDRRGMLFAPVYFNAGVYSRPGFSYSPATVIDLGVFANQLFLRPRYRHYYFGDYYAASYSSAGFYPWFSFQSGRHGYDPIYAHQRWQYRQDPQWEHRVAADFENRRVHEDARPLRTWAAQRALGTNDPRARERGLVVAAPLGQLTRGQDTRLQIQPVDTQERQRLGKYGQEVQRFREQRQKLETQAAATSPDKAPKDVAPARVRFPNSPIVANPTLESEKGQAPPKTYELPKPDLKVEAKPRAARSPEQRQPRAASRRPLDTPQSQPKAERQAPQPKAERQAPQPKAERGSKPAGPNQDKPKGKD